MHSNEKTTGTTIENLIILEDDFIAVQFFDVCVLYAVCSSPKSFKHEETLNVN